MTIAPINGNNAGPPPRFDTSKGATLSTWLNYVLCGAQQKAGALGYSPLPKNLVVGGFQQVDHVPGHVATPDLKQLNGCNNPTYSNGVNHLIVDAPQPNPCDKVGQPLTCGTAAPPTTTQTTAAGGPTTTAAPRQGPTGKAEAGHSPCRQHRSAPAITDRVDVDRPGDRSGSGDRPGRRTVALPGAVPVALQTPSSSKNWLLPLLTALDIIAAIALPGIVLTWLRRRRASE